jgi:hypothetical protein
MLKFVNAAINDLKYYDTSRYGHDQNYLEERQVVHMSKELANVIGDTGPDLKHLNGAHR